MDNNALVSMVVGLLVICIALFIFYVFMKKLSSVTAKNRSSKYIKVIDRLILSRDKYIEIIEVGDEVLVLGISSSSMQILHKAKKEDFEILSEEIKYDTFKEIFTKMFNKKRKNNEDEFNNEKTGL